MTAVLCRRLQRTGFRGLHTTSRQSAAFNWTRLPSRNVLRVSGNDATKFLQGLVSNDVLRLENSAELNGKAAFMYAGVLRANGRMMYDIFIHKPQYNTNQSQGTDQQPTFYLEHEREGKEEESLFRAYFKRHILRAKVKLGPASQSEMQITAVWRTGEKIEDEGDQLAIKWLEENNFAADERASGLGWRKIGPSSSTEAPPSNLFEAVSPQYYQMHRLILGVPEGKNDWPQLPLEGNLELMGGVDYKKGCYVGQELTARTHHRGVVRKRCVPVRLFREGEEVPSELIPAGQRVVPSSSMYTLPPPGSSAILIQESESRQKSSGKIGSSLPIVTENGLESFIGLASLRLDDVKEDNVFRIESISEQTGSAVDGEIGHDGRNRWRMVAFMPTWLQSKLNNMGHDDQVRLQEAHNERVYLK